MSTRETEILDGILNVLPEMSENGRERLLGFVDGIAFVTERQREPVERLEESPKHSNNETKR
jgi:hypothetical protein